jgi:hypothetical protein
MAKQSKPTTDKGRPSIGTLPSGAGPDAQLLDFLTGEGASAKPPVAPSQTVGLPGLQGKGKK